MSVKIMGRIWETALRPNLMLVLQAMADHADHDGYNVHPGVRLIARKTSYSVRNVQRLQRELRELGILVVTKRGAGPGRPPAWEAGAGRSGRMLEYRIDLSALPETGDKMAHLSEERDDTTGTKQTTPRVLVRTEPKAEPTAARARDRETNVPADIQALAFEVFGQATTAPADWWGVYPPDWIRRALVRTKKMGKRKPAYTAAILKEWWASGKPDDSREPSAGGSQQTAGNGGKYTL